MRAQLLAALEESLHDAPDPAKVLSAVRTRIVRRRRRRRTLAVAAVLLVAALALVADVTHPVTFNAPASEPIPVGDWASTIEVGWVPDGMTATRFTNTSVDELVMYDSEVANMRIRVDKMRWSRRLDLPGWRQIEINGRPAIEAWQRPLPYIVFRLPSGRWAEVDIYRAVVGVPDMRDAAVRVASSIREVSGVPLRVGFAPTYLPPGQRIIGMSTGSEDPSGHGQIHCAAGSLQPGAVSELESGGLVFERLQPDVGPGLDIAVVRDQELTLDSERIPDIQGRPAYLVGPLRSVVVRNFHGGRLIVTNAMLDRNTSWEGEAPPPDKRLPVEELIKVAEGVRWVG